MVFPPPDKPPPQPAPDEDEVRLGSRCTPAVAAALPRGPTMAGREVPTPALTEDCESATERRCEPCSTLVAPPRDRLLKMERA